MANEYCKDCGENKFDCDCDVLQEWYCFDDCKPSPGQKCLIKSVQILEAYYAPKVENEFYVVDCHEVGTITAWRPLYEK
jgi:hypothetical protein